MVVAVAFVAAFVSPLPQQRRPSSSFHRHPLVVSADTRFERPGKFVWRLDSLASCQDDWF